MERVLVTGANGFIGSHLVEGLLHKGYQVRALVRRTADLKWLAGLPIELVYGAITDINTLYPVVENIDFVCHTAGATKAKTFADFALVNYGGTENLLNACLRKNPNLKRFVLYSTLAAAGPSESDQSISEDKACFPVSNYGTTKLQAESAVLEMKDKVPSAILRLSAVYGPRDKETLTYFKFLKKGIRPVFGGNFSVCYVKDVVNAGILTLQKNIKSGTIYNISSPGCYTYDELSKIAVQFMNKKTVKIKLPKPILMLYASIVKRFSQDSILGPDKMRELTQKCWVCDIKKAQDELGFITSYSLEDGLRETIEWYERQGWL